MQFDPKNKVVKLCAEGMELEGQGRKSEALERFLHAWKLASNDFEKFTAAHYVARHQSNATEKLKWDQTALDYALRMGDESVKATYPSLYLNIAKCYEDLSNTEKALENYRLANSFTKHLPENGYGDMIKNGITNGIKRLTIG